MTGIIAGILILLIPDREPLAVDKCIVTDVDWDSDGFVTTFTAMHHVARVKTYMECPPGEKCMGPLRLDTVVPCYTWNGAEWRTGTPLTSATIPIVFVWACLQAIVGMASGMSNAGF